MFADQVEAKLRQAALALHCWEHEASPSTDASVWMPNLGWNIQGDTPQ